MFEQRGNIHLRFITCLLFSILFRELTVIWRSVVGSHLLLSDSSDELCHSFVQRSNIISDPMTILPVYSGFFALLYEVRNGGHLLEPISFVAKKFGRFGQ